jgi:hypothetical protein
MGVISDRAKKRRAAEPAPPAKATPTLNATRPATKKPQAAPAPEPFDIDEDDDLLDDEEEEIEEEDDDLLDDEDEEDDNQTTVSDDDEDEGDDIEPEEEEVPPAPVKRAKPATAPAKPAATKKPAPPPVEEDEEEEEDDEIDESDEELDYLDGDGDDDDAEVDEEEEQAPAKSKRDPASFNTRRKSIELDFTNTDDKPPSIDPGEYTARVQDVEFKESQSGNPMLEWSFKITGGKFRNKDLRFWTSLSQDARWSTARTLKDLGVPVAGKKFTLDPEKLIGKPCKILVVADGRNEDFPYKVQRVMPADAAAIKAAKAAKDLV